MKVLIIISLPVVLFGTIFFNDNFEDSLLNGWTTAGTVQCAVDPAPAKYWLNEPINKDFIRIQYHGLVSMKISDRTDADIAYAIHSFPSIQAGTEYLTEFYFHFYPEDKGIFKNFYLYQPQVYQSGNYQNTDIVLKLNVVKGDSVPLSVIDGQGNHENVYYLRPDTIFTVSYGNSLNYNIPLWDTLIDFPIERWYRFQIHRIKTDHIDLYINGQNIGSYVPTISTNPTRIFLGTENPAIESGVGYYDDFIVTTPPQGQHPRLLFSAADLPNLRLRKTDSVSVLPRNYKAYWNKDTSKAKYWVHSNRDIGDYLKIIHFPYNEPHYDSIQFLREWFWSVDYCDWTLQRFQTIALRWLVGELDPTNPNPPDTAYLNYLRTTINAFANWNHWMKPLEYRGLILKHNQPFEFGLAFVYDCIFDSLSSYQKMSVQNAILSQGIVTQWLLWKTRGFDDPSVPFYPGHPQWAAPMIGFAALVLDDDSLRNFYADYTEAIEESLFIGAQSTGMLPVIGPDGEYAHGSLSYGACNLNWHTLFWEANRRVRGHDIFQNATYRNRFENYPLFRLYTLCPGSSNEFRSGDDVFYNQSPWHQTFCWVSNQQNQVGQWFYKRLYSYSVSDEWTESQYHGFNFLFFDDDLTPQMPTFKIARNFGNFWIGFRTGFGTDQGTTVRDSNEVAMVFDTSGKVPVHRHQSYNNFVIGTNGSWLINEQAIRGKTFSVLHNVIMVDSLWDPDPALPNQYDWNYGQISSNRADFKGFYEDTAYAYCANAVPCSCYQRLSKFIRKIVFTKEGYILMKDEVKTNTPAQGRKYLWLVHIPTSTPIYGDSLIYSQNQYQIKFFSPASRTIQSFSVLLYPDPDNTVASGIMVANTNLLDSTEFLSAIVMKRPSFPWPPTIKKVDGTTMLGADINSKVVVLYGKGQIGNIAAVTYTVPHSFSTGLKNVLSDLKSSRVYYVLLNGIEVLSFTSTACGTGHFRVTSLVSLNTIQVTDIPPPK